MQCFYINLEDARARRERIEASFQVDRPPGWTLSRFSALDAGFVRQRAIAGRIRENEKACFASHRELIRSTLKDDRPILVLEDDAVFCPQTFAALERNWDDEPDGPWDITFTDVLLPDLPAIVWMAQLRQQWEARRVAQANSECIFLDLGQVNFCSSTAYVVHGRSKAKLVGLLDAFRSLEAPYDLFLRQLVHERRLRARCFFPFVTTLAAAADVSQRQLAHDRAPNLIWNTFRRLMCIARDLPAEEATLGQISRELCEAESRAVGTLVAASLSVFKPR